MTTSPVEPSGFALKPGLTNTDLIYPTVRNEVIVGSYQTAVYRYDVVDEEVTRLASPSGKIGRHRDSVDGSIHYGSSSIPYSFRIYSRLTFDMLTFGAAG